MYIQSSDRKKTGIRGSDAADWRTTHGVSQRDLASSLGVSVQTIITWEGKADLSPVKFERCKAAVLAIFEKNRASLVV